MAKVGEEVDRPVEVLVDALAGQDGIVARSVGLGSVDLEERVQLERVGQAGDGFALCLVRRGPALVAGVLLVRALWSDDTGLARARGCRDLCAAFNNNMRGGGRAPDLALRVGGHDPYQRVVAHPGDAGQVVGPVGAAVLGGVSRRSFSSMSS